MAAAVRDTTDRLSEAQFRALRVQRVRLDLDDATARRAFASYKCKTKPPRDGMAWPEIGKPCASSRHLSRDQARHLITRWSLAGAAIGAPYSGSRTEAIEAEKQGATPLATPAQRALIERLIPEVTWRTDAGYDGWVTSRFSPAPNGVRTYRDAEAVIEALHAMRDRQHERTR